MNPTGPLPDPFEYYLNLPKPPFSTLNEINKKRKAMKESVEFQWTDELVKKFANDLFVDKMADDKAVADFKSSYSVSSSGKDWEIQCLVVDTRNFWLQKNGLYKNELFGEECSAEVIMKWPNFKYIHSVKRISDGEIFSIGDSVRYCPASRYGSFVIEKIWINTIDKERCMVSDKDQCLVEAIDTNLEKIKVPIQEKLLPVFTTEDGVPIYDIDQHLYWVLTTGDWKTESSMLPANVNNYNKTWKAFSTDAARKEYILINKPVFNQREVQNFMMMVGKIPISTAADKLMDLAKQRIQGGKE